LIDLTNKALKLDQKDFIYNQTILSYRIRSILVDSYSTIDAVKANLYFFNNNVNFNENEIVQKIDVLKNSSNYKYKKNDDFTNCQKHKESFLSLLNEILDKLDINKNPSDIFDKFNLINLHENSEDVE